MADLIYATSGINLENWSGQQDKQVSSLTVLLKQAANLMVFQKYFDQWDYSDKLLGKMMLDIILNNWTAEKVQLMIGEEPTPYFYSRIFSKYQRTPRLFLRSLRRERRSSGHGRSHACTSRFHARVRRRSTPRVKT